MPSLRSDQCTEMAVRHIQSAIHMEEDGVSIMANTDWYMANVWFRKAATLIESEKQPPKES